MRILSKFYLLALLTVAFSCATPENEEDSLYQGFQNPPAQARPFVRWWWNGNKITGDELIRELDILKKAGFGGIEINPIAFPEPADDLGIESLEWLSAEWNEMVKLASTEAKQRDMITDIIVGSGWPFGGEFLKPDQLIQRVIIDQIELEGPVQVQENLNSMLEKLKPRHREGTVENALSNELMFISLVPAKATSIDQVQDLTAEWDNQNGLNYELPAGKYELIYGIRQTGHREVMHGTLGAAGPVMDHYRAEVVEDYLGRLKKIESDTGLPLDSLIRALFCDSIELAGANWTDGLADKFESVYGYALKPFYPFIFHHPYEGYTGNNYNQKFKDELSRVRYDYNRLLVKEFLDNFTRTFQKFSTENKLLARYQAYGTPFLMGMVEGNMITDIPESNNWIYSAPMDTPKWVWNKPHGYMIWNMYAASGGHLAGRKIISCEAMTNTRGVFKTTLEDIKQADDMNFITGINHSVLHGFNYSPPEAGFPGWVRYGAYFNAQNTWWPYLNHWTDYNARLSYILQETKPIKQIAILAPTTDFWSEIGLTRTPFHTTPWYVHELWESLSQNGSSCDYVNEDVIQNATMEEGMMKYGPMDYQVLILASNKSMNPVTANAILQFVESGGKLVLLDNIPSRSPSKANASQNDQEVKKAFDKIQNDFEEKFFYRSVPAQQQGDLLEFTGKLIKEVNIQPDVLIENPDPDIYQIRHQDQNRDVYFFVNSHRKENATITISFPGQEKSAWLWDPETGKRSFLAESSQLDNFKLYFKPLESKLIVFDDQKGEQMPAPLNADENKSIELENEWKLNFSHFDNSSKSLTTNELSDFSRQDDSFFNAFAGVVTYKTNFNSVENFTMLDLGNDNQGITEVILNGEKVGINWYGQARFNLAPYLKQGENELEIRLTTTLSNYAQQLEDPVAQRWTNGHELVSAGLKGPVRLLHTK